MNEEKFSEWIGPMLQSVHRKGYQAPPIRCVYIPKPGKQERRPLGVPSVRDRALQRSVAEVLSTIYEQDFLSCSFGGRPGIGAHSALSTLNEIIVGRKVGWVLEADLKNFFGSLDHGWLRFVEFGRFADRHVEKRGRRRPDTIYFLGFTLYCTRNQKGNYKVGFRTEKTRFRRSLCNLCEMMRRMRHLPVKEQVINLNRVLRGHYAHYGIAGNFRALQRVYR